MTGDVVRANIKLEPDVWSTLLNNQSDELSVDCLEVICRDSTNCDATDCEISNFVVEETIC